MINKINGVDIHPNFYGAIPKNKKLDKTNIMEVINKDGLSPISKSLVKKMGDVIEYTWGRMKNKKNKNPYLLFTSHKTKGNPQAYLQPLYNSKNGSLFLEIDKYTNVERIVIDRKSEYFTYEEARKTPHGYMTTKTFDSRTQKNVPEISEKVNNYISEYFPSIIRRNKPKEID